MLLKKILPIFLSLTLFSCNFSNDEATLTICDIDKVDIDHFDYKELRFTLLEFFIFDSLCIPDSNYKFHHILARDIKLLPGGKAIEIRLRDGIKFHDGREVTGEDVVTSLGPILESDKEIIENFGNVTVKVVDRMTVRINTNKKIWDPHLLATKMTVLSKDLNGTGPFRFSRWIENGLELEANDNYFEGKPSIRKLRYIYETNEERRVKMLLNGEADLLVWLSPEVIQFLKKDARFYVNDKPYNFYTALFLNNDSPIFRDRMIRKAISIAINKEKLVSKLLVNGGIMVSDPLPTDNHPSKFTEKNDYKPTDALALINNAGWRDVDGDGIVEKGGEKLIINLSIDGRDPELTRIADQLSQDLFEIGVGVSLKTIYTDSISHVPSNADAVLHSRSSKDTANISTWRSSSDLNISNYRSMEMDALLDRLIECSSHEEKKTIYSEMHNIFSRDVPAVFLYRKMIYTAVNKRFKGAEEFVGNAYSLHKIKDWKINEKQAQP